MMDVGPVGSFVSCIARLPSFFGYIARVGACNISLTTLIQTINLPLIYNDNSIVYYVMDAKFDLHFFCVMGM
jgi:hypothetical protein